MRHARQAKCDGGTNVARDSSKMLEIAPRMPIANEILLQLGYQLKKRLTDLAFTVTGNSGDFTAFDRTC
jgi:hypothetical protein